MVRTHGSFRFAAACTLAAAGVLAPASPSHAFRMIQNNSTGRVTSGNLVTCNDPGGFTHWTTASIGWYHNTSGQGAGKATALQNAMAAWTNVTGADHVLTYLGTTTSGWATDGKNTVLWAIGNGCTGSCLALTALVLQQPGQVIVETDVTFNASYTWNTNGSDHDTEAVAAHELGHSLGIHHTELTSIPRPTMYAGYFGADGRSLESDDRSALQCSQTRYPVAPPGAPPTPASLTVASEACFGYVTLTWSSSAGATSYQVQKSNSSTFTNPAPVYSGANTSFFGNVAYTSGNTWFRVRACNANGCSLYRNGDTSVRYYTGCL